MSGETGLKTRSLPTLVATIHDRASMRVGMIYEYKQLTHDMHTHLGSCMLDDIVLGC